MRASVAHLGQSQRRSVWLQRGESYEGERHEAKLKERPGSDDAGPA